MENRTLLTAEKVAELTGIRRGNNKKSYSQLQIEWLLRHGYPDRLNAARRAIVPRSAIEASQVPTTPVQKEWIADAWAR